jgi:hypothetical protein
MRSRSQRRSSNPIIVFAVARTVGGNALGEAMRAA